MVKVKIAVVQLKAIQHQPDKTRKKIESFVSNASGKADVIIFPEDCIEGIISNKKELADSKKENRNFFISLANKYKIDIVTGSTIEKEEGKFWNTSYYIDKNGKTKGVYRKMALWHPERRYVSQGEKISAFNTRFGKAAIVICWDLAFPEIFRELIKRNVKLIYCPSYWTYNDAFRGRKYNKNAEIILTDTLCSTRAFEANAAVIYCNASENVELGRFKLDLMGNSQISLPYLGTVKKLNHDHEEMFIQEIDLTLLKDSEKDYKIRKDVIKNYLKISN